MKALLFFVIFSFTLQATDIALTSYEVRMTTATYDEIKKLTSDEDLFAKCRELTAEKKAHLDNIQYSRVKSGQRAHTRSCMELIYPCEQEPSAMGGNLQAEPYKRDFILPTSMIYTPTAFEPRDVGVYFEQDSTVDERRTIDVRIHLSKVDYTSDKVFFSHKDHSGNRLEIKLPLFYKQEKPASVTVRSAKPRFIGMTNPLNQKGLRDTSVVILYFIIAEKITP